MSSDESPILIDLLDSLTSINKRLNLIETALSIQAAEEEADGVPQGDGLVDALADPLADTPGAFSSPPFSSPLSSSLSQPLPTDTSPQALSYPLSLSLPLSLSQPIAYPQYYAQPPPLPPPPYQPYAQSIPGALLLPANDAAPTSAGWPGGTAHASASASAAARPRPSPKRSPQRSSQLLRLRNVHARDSMSDDGTDPDADVDSDTGMHDLGDATACAGDGDDMPPADYARQDALDECADHEEKETEKKEKQPADPEQDQPDQHPPAADARLEALPEGFLVTGRATLQEELDRWTIPRGYSMRINGTRSHGRRQKIRMVCFRGGRSRLRPKEEDTNNINNRRKPTTDRVSKKCECPFRFELVEVCPGADEYAVHYTNAGHTQHNHAAADLMLDPRARKLPSALKAEVDQWLGGSTNTTKWTIAKIQAELQKRGYGHVLDFDLRNRKRALLHKERLAQQAGGASSKGSAGSAGSAGDSSAGNTPSLG